MHFLNHSIHLLLQSIRLWWLVILVMVVVFLVLLLYYRKKRKQTVHSSDFLELLKDTQRVSHTQSSLARQFLFSFSETKNNYTDKFLTSLMMPKSIRQSTAIAIGSMFLQKKGINGRVVEKLFRLRDEVYYQYTSLHDNLRHYKTKIAENEAMYQNNLIELGNMHDALGRYMNNKNFDRSNGSEWYEGYFSIFGTWFRNGASRDMETTYTSIVSNIIALNNEHRHVPFVIQTTACSLNCEHAFRSIVTLNNELKGKIAAYHHYNRLTYKMVRLLGQNRCPRLPEKQKANVVTAPVYNSLPPESVSTQDKVYHVPTSSATTKAKYLLYFWAATLFVLAIAYFLIPTLRPQQLPKTRRPDSPYRQALTKTLPMDTNSIIKVLSVDTVNIADTLSAIDDFKVLFDTPAHSADFVYGIDVSRYQGKLMEEMENLDTLHFVICKATEGSTLIDREFGLNWMFIRQKGLIRGAYHFFHSKGSPVLQAQLFLETLKELRPTDLPPIVDVEEASIRSNVTPSQLDSSLLIFLRYVQEKTNRKPIIYSDLSFANRFLVNDSLAYYPLWLAEYNKQSVPHVPRVWKDKGYVIWQRSSTYNIGTRVADFDIFNGNGRAFAEFIRNH